MMKSSKKALLCTYLLLYSFLQTASADLYKDFISCLVKNSNDPSSMSEVISKPNTSSYRSILNHTIQNLRFTTPDTPKPGVIITPNHESQIQTAIHCSKKHGLQIRILSGGHDFEGMSFVSEVPFFILNMFNYRSVSVDVKSRTAWVGSGATVGETYYAINQTNSSLTFAGGNFPTVGIGGLVSGGGYGPLLRKYGLAADTVVDARIIDAYGRILNRETMGEDLFWAIRGGVGASFAVILEYKVKLVWVAKKITAFMVKRTAEQGATKLVHKWQYVAPTLPEDLLLHLQITTVHLNRTGARTIQVSFTSAYPGGVDVMLGLIQEYFPELGIVKEDCVQLSWLEFFPFFFELPIESTPTILRSREPPVPKVYFKSKSDVFQNPIPEEGLEKIWAVMLKIDNPPGRMDWVALAGILDEISESETPFPYRAGYKFLTYKKITWNGTDPKVVEERLAWMRELHRVMGQYVNHKPRGAYADYRDLDLGVNNNKGETSVEQSRIWGPQYFQNNFDRLVKVKTLADPENYFKNEQSIPPLPSRGRFSLFKKTNC